eukprot:scaffold41705_cov51-Phaeocystis_antarctica.AAC.2
MRDAPHLLPHTSPFHSDDAFALEDAHAGRLVVLLEVRARLEVGEAVGDAGLATPLRSDDEDLGRHACPCCRRALAQRLLSKPAECLTRVIITEGLWAQRRRFKHSEPVASQTRADRGGRYGGGGGAPLAPRRRGELPAARAPRSAPARVQSARGAEREGRARVGPATSGDGGVRRAGRVEAADHAARLPKSRRGVAQAAAGALRHAHPARPADAAAGGARGGGAGRKGGGGAADAAHRCAHAHHGAGAAGRTGRTAAGAGVRRASGASAHVA